jgi:uncharacterized protein
MRRFSHLACLFSRANEPATAVSLGSVPSSILQDLVIFAAGIAAGMINVIVGSGTLITFPILLAFNYPPVLANVSNNVGLIPGSVSGAIGYRAELSGQRDRVLRLGSASLSGGLVGAILLLVLPASAFQEIVPALILVALVMVVAQPKLATWVAARKAGALAGAGFGAAPGPPGTGPAVPGLASGPASGLASGLASGGGTATAVATRTATKPVAADVGGPLLWVLVFCTGIYGGYFGAAQGVLLIGLLGVALEDSLQRINAVKNILAALVNGIAAVVFIMVSHVAWAPAALIALGSVIGGQAGAKVGRKLSPWTMRAVIVCVGVAALVKLLA